MKSIVRGAGWSGRAVGQVQEGLEHWLQHRDGFIGQLFWLQSLQYVKKRVQGPFANAGIFKLTLLNDVKDAMQANANNLRQWQFLIDGLVG